MPPILRGARNTRAPGEVAPVVQTARVRAPQLRGRRWLNTGGRDLLLADLRGNRGAARRWTPGMDAGRRERITAAWGRAVSRSLDGKADAD